MPEYIDREKYCAEVCRCNKEQCDKSKCPVWNAPAADVAPVVHGEWMRYRNTLWHYCSNCLEDALMSKSTGTEVLSDLCPHCGAKMDLEDDE